MKNPRPHDNLNSDQEGFGMVEILVCLGLIVVMVLAIARVIDSVNRLQRSSQFKTKAFAYARQPLEILNDNKDLLACHTAGTTCTTSDNQTCQPEEAYDVCWTEYPPGHDGQTRFYLQESGGNWQLQPLLAGAEESIIGDPDYTRVLSIENIMRDDNGDISDTGTIVDYNSKRITSVVYWSERGEKRNITLETVLTLWQNL